MKNIFKVKYEAIKLLQRCLKMKCRKPHRSFIYLFYFIIIIFSVKNGFANFKRLLLFYRFHFLEQLLYRIFKNPAYIIYVSDHIMSSNSINEQLKQFENLKRKLESPELQQIVEKNLDKLREQNRMIHSEILKQSIDRMELLIIDEDLIAAAGYKIYIEHLISLAQHL